ncbi:MAG TPA: hypothetical protein VLL97_08310, partial [Acidobacteriota bacterium]|nr:hypothetical protein [Acidobacteriota bacterium]
MRQIFLPQCCALSIVKRIAMINPLSPPRPARRSVRAVFLAVMAAAFLSQWSPAVFAQEEARVELFSPEGTVRGVRQARARFSAPMVPFGDLRDTAQPFVIDCGEPGTARWVDDRNWVYDFDRDLPAGVYCSFTVREGLRALAGGEIAGRRSFSFSTGGPAILSSNPYQNMTISEDQVFILSLDAEPLEQSVLDNVYFSMGNFVSRIAVRILSGEERELILKSFGRRFEPESGYLLLLQARQPFPNDAAVFLVWDRGVASKSGIATAKAQMFHFRTRPVFTAGFSCERVNPDAACVPVSPMKITFSAPVPLDDALKTVLRGPDGRRWQPAKQDDHGDGDAQVTHNLTF